MLLTVSLKSLSLLVLLDDLEAFLGACFSFSVSPKNIKNETNIDA
jgi:hypothetical protein